ncbi:hypothetical protein BC826DRAFT_976820 [Russula brevipes]|nr:hypothetical protein BC826DRAFT_976820 [Russula brevipes]
MLLENSRNYHKITVTPHTTGIIWLSLAPAHIGPMTIEVIVDPPNKRVFRQTLDIVGHMQFTLEPALTGPLTIEVTAETPKKHVSHETVETQQTIQTEPESSQEVGGAGVASCRQKRKVATADTTKMPATKRSKPE